MSTLADFTSPLLIIPELQSRAATDVIAELCSLLSRQGRLTNSATFSDAVIKREHICPTSMAPGWALPHARLQGLTQLSFVLARSSQPLLWFGAGNIQPQMIFLFAVPEAEAITYLSLVSALAKLHQNPALLDQLRAAPDANSMFKILQEIPLRLRGQSTLAAAGRLNPSGN